MSDSARRFSLLALLSSLQLVLGYATVSAQSRPSLATEVTTPLYSSARPAAVLVEKRLPSDAPERSDAIATRRTSTIDTNTRWQFVSRESIAIDSSIIRLGDVIRPLEPDMVSWLRLSQSTIGLMPADGGDAKISRDRLANMIAGANATPLRIKIYGPETIVVQRAPHETTQATVPVAYQEEPISPSSTQAADQPAIATVATASFDDQSSSSPIRTAKRIDSDITDRLEDWVRISVRNQFQEIHSGFDYEVKFDPAEFGTLEKTQGIREFVFLDPPPVWSHDNADSVDCRVRLLGRAGLDDCEGIVRLTFHPRTSVVTARRSLRRGHRVTTSDLQYEPYAVEGVSLPADVVGSPDELIDLEVVGLVRAGVALTRSDFAAPRVIRRGELVEVQVGGGGVRVTTAAKALADGATGELIEIETLQPKKRLLAKVISSALVEIITQAPRVAAQSKRPTR